MSLENIVNKILSEANELSKMEVRDAEFERDKILANAKKEAELILKKSEEEALAESERIAERGKALINVDKRKMVLAKKQEIIKKVFDDANVDFEEYRRELLKDVADKLF